MAGKVVSVTSYDAATGRAVVDVFGQALTNVLNVTGEILQPGWVVWAEQRGEALRADWVVTGVYSPVVRYQQGTFDTVFSAQNSKSGTLTFPAAFTVVPVVTLTPAIGSSLAIAVNVNGAVTTTTIPWIVFNRDAGTNISGTATIHWTARLSG